MRLFDEREWITIGGNAIFDVRVVYRGDGGHREVGVRRNKGRVRMVGSRGDSRLRDASRGMKDVIGLGVCGKADMVERAFIGVTMIDFGV